MDYQKVVVNHDIPFRFIRDQGKQAPGRGADDAVVEDSGPNWSTWRAICRFCPTSSAADVGADHQYPPFVPAQFKGRTPKAGLQRGVKLIGRPAITSPPIWTRVRSSSRTPSASPMPNRPRITTQLGRDVESQVLARAIHAHIHRRVFLNGNKTVSSRPRPGPMPTSAWAGVFALWSARPRRDCRGAARRPDRRWVTAVKRPGAGGCGP